MQFRKAIARWATVGVASLGAQSAVQAQGWEVQPCDVDDYITKAIGIEEPWLENAAYGFAQMANGGTPRALSLAPEVEARFSSRLGMELDLPSYNADLPLGQKQGVFGPAAAGLKFAALHTCNLSDGRATLLTAEVEGQYWIKRQPDLLPGEGNALTAQVMWAQLWYPWFTQGEAGYTQRVGAGVSSGWFANVSVGHAIGAAYAVQVEVEVDNQLTLDGGNRGIEASVMPQLAYHVAPAWLVAVGQQASFEQGNSRPQWSTWLMVEREF